MAFIMTMWMADIILKYKLREPDLAVRLKLRPTMQIRMADGFIGLILLQLPRMERLLSVLLINMDMKIRSTNLGWMI